MANSPREPPSPPPPRASFADIFESHPAAGVEQLDTERFSAADVAVLPEYALVVAGCFDRVVRVYRTDGRIVHTLRGHGASVRGVTTIIDDIVASVALDGSVITWRATNGTIIDKFVMENEQCECVQVYDDVLVIGTTGGSVMLVGHSRGKQLSLRAVLDKKVHGGRLVAAIGAGAGVIVSCSHDRTAAVWHAEALRHMATLDFNAEVLCVALNDVHLAFGCSNGTVYVHSVAGGARLGHVNLVDFCVNDIRFVDDDTLICAGLSGCVAFVSLSEFRVLSRVAVQRNCYMLTAAAITMHRMVVAGVPRFAATCDLPEGITAKLSEGVYQQGEEPLMDEAEEFADAPEELEDVREESEASLDDAADEYVDEERNLDSGRLISNTRKEDVSIRKPASTDLRTPSPLNKPEVPNSRPINKVQPSSTTNKQPVPQMKSVTSFQRKTRLFENLGNEKDTVPPIRMMKKKPLSPVKEEEEEESPMERKAEIFEKVGNNVETKEKASSGLERPLSIREKVEMFAVKENPFKMESKKLPPVKEHSPFIERKTEIFSSQFTSRVVEESEDHDPASMTTDIPSPQKSIDDPPIPPTFSSDARNTEKIVERVTPTWNTTPITVRSGKHQAIVSPRADVSRSVSAGRASPPAFDANSGSGKRVLEKSEKNVRIDVHQRMNPTLSPAFGGVSGKSPMKPPSDIERKFKSPSPSAMFNSGDFRSPGKVAEKIQSMENSHSGFKLDTRLSAPPALKVGSGSTPNNVEFGKSRNIHAKSADQHTKAPSSSPFARGKEKLEKSIEWERNTSSDDDTRVSKSSSVSITSPAPKKIAEAVPSRDRGIAPMARRKKAEDKPVKSSSVKERARKLEKKATELGNSKQAKEDRDVPQRSRSNLTEILANRARRKIIPKPVSNVARRSQSSLSEMASNRPHSLDREPVREIQPNSSETDNSGTRRSQSNLTEMVGNRTRSNYPNGSARNPSKFKETSSSGAEQSQSNSTETVVYRSPSSVPEAGQRSQSKVTEIVANRARSNSVEPVRRGPVHARKEDTNGAIRSQSNLTEKVANRARAFEPEVGQQSRPKVTEPVNGDTQRSQSNLTDIVANRGCSNVPEGEQRSQSNLTEIVANRGRSNVPEGEQRSHSNFGETVGDDAPRSYSNLMERINRWGAPHASVAQTDSITSSNNAEGSQGNAGGGWKNSRRSATTHGVSESNQSEREQASVGNGWGDSQRSVTTHGMDDAKKNMASNDGDNVKSSRGRKAKAGEEGEKTPPGKDRSRGKTGGRGTNRTGQRQRQAQKASVVRSRSGVIQYIQSRRVAKSRSDVVQFSQAQKVAQDRNNAGEDAATKKYSDYGRRKKYNDDGLKNPEESTGTETRSAADKLSFDTLLQKFNSSFRRPEPDS